MKISTEKPAKVLDPLQNSISFARGPAALPARDLQSGVFNGSSCKIEISQELYFIPMHRNCQRKEYYFKECEGRNPQETRAGFLVPRYKTTVSFGSPNTRSTSPRFLRLGIYTSPIGSGSRRNRLLSQPRSPSAKHPRAYSAGKQNGGSQEEGHAQIRPAKLRRDSPASAHNAKLHGVSRAGRNPAHFSCKRKTFGVELPKPVFGLRYARKNRGIKAPIPDFQAEGFARRRLPRWQQCALPNPAFPAWSSAQGSSRLLAHRR